MDNNTYDKFFLESWRLANKSSEHIRWVLTGAVAVYFLQKDHVFMGFWCFWINIALTFSGLVLIFVLYVMQYKMLKLDEEFYTKGVERGQNQEHWSRISEEMDAIKIKNKGNLKNLNRLLLGVYFIVGISVIMTQICIRFPF